MHCEEKGTNADGSISAVCWVGRTHRSDGEDLAAWLLTQGWAVARPGAPFEYMTLEAIARANHRGVWGFEVDSVQ